MKLSRQSKIIEIIDNNQIETQEDLMELLKEAGYTVTQATISRDIKELKLIKVTGKNGRQCYSVLKETGELYNDRVVRVFKESVLSVDTAAFLVVVRTLPAMAQAAALAIDSIDHSGIVGTVGGDDTIFVAVRTQEDVEPIVEEFRKMIRS